MPLLSLCLSINQCARQHPKSCSVRMPVTPQRSSFLERWGFLNFLQEQGVVVAEKLSIGPYAEAEHSRVLPISYLANMQTARNVRDALLKADATLREVLSRDACMNEADVAGLADLVVFELCKNVVEHSRCEQGGFAIAHASKPSPEQAEVRNRNAAEWESGFYRTIGEEGVTEIVVGDSGVGIVESLRKVATQCNKSSTKDVLEYAFEPYSTSKSDPGTHTRGLWCVKEKVRDFRGLLYVRSSSEAIDLTALSCVSEGAQRHNPPVGLGAYWDFLNDPDQDKPTFVLDESCFPGTQLQILLPQHSHTRPKTYVALHTVEGRREKVRPKASAVPQHPHAVKLRSDIRTLQGDEVLFIDMSSMETTWTRETVERLMEDICTELVAGPQRRVWLLNPDERIVGLMRMATSVRRLWQEQAVMLPIVRVEDMSRPPRVFSVLSDPSIMSDSPGDSTRARQRLADELGLTVEAPPRSMAEVLTGLDNIEITWIDDALSRNFAIVRRKRTRGQIVLIPELDIRELATTAGMMLLEKELHRCVSDRLLQLQRSMGPSPVWYRLPSKLYATDYVDDRILYGMSAWLRTRIDAWLEQRVTELRPNFVVSYTELGNELLTHAVKAYPEATPIPLGDYLEVHAGDGMQKLKRIGRGSTVVFLIDISGSGKTLDRAAKFIEGQGAKMHILCVIDTISQSDRVRHRTVDALYKRQHVHSLLSSPIEKRSELPRHGSKSKWPVVNIDPVSLLPTPEVLDAAKLMTDGEFWGLVARIGALSTTPISYKGHEFGSFIWLTGLFEDQDCADRITKHLHECCDGDKLAAVLVSDASAEFLQHTLLHSKLSAEFGERLWLEGHPRPLDEDSLEGQHVAIFCAAATSGSGIARLLTKCRSARRVHICIFINRMPIDIASAFLRRQGVTLSTFQRLNSASPSLRQHSYRTAALRSLDTYRRSCLSNRLLLFADEQISALRQTHTFLESPGELSEGSEILASPMDPGRFATNATYNLTTPEGEQAIHDLIQTWNPDDLPWLRAVLEEAACRYEVTQNTGGQDKYFKIVQDLYACAKRAQQANRMRDLVLVTMLLERLPGQRTEKSPVAKRFAELLWTDFRRASEENDTGFSAVLLRTCAKLAPTVILQNLSDAVVLCARSRIAELTLSLELSKMRDEVDLAPELFSALQVAALKLAPQAGNPNSQSVALADVLQDLGMKQEGAQVVPVGWQEVTKLLAAQPPDEARTIRTAIRHIRHLLPDAYVSYFHRLKDNRFITADAWPPIRTMAAPPVPAGSSFTLRLVGADGLFFSPDIAQEAAPAAQELAEKLAPFFKALKADSASLFLAMLRPSPEVTLDYPVGLLRVVLPFSRGKTSGIVTPQRDLLADVAKGICALLGRREATHVAKVGAWQFEHAVSGLLRPLKLPSWEKPKVQQAIVDLMWELLDADIGRIALLDIAAHSWRSGPRSPESSNRWEGSRKGIAIRDTDESSATVQAAKASKPLVIADVQQPEKSQPPNDWVHGCLVVPLVHEDRGCDTVVTLWHHAVDWFSQFDAALLDSLAAIGGAWLHMAQAIELHKAREEKQIVQTVALHIAHNIKNRLPVRQFMNLAQCVPENLRGLAEGCLTHVQNVHRMQRRFYKLATMERFFPDKSLTASALFENLHGHLQENCKALDVSVGTTRLEDFGGQVSCNLSSLKDDLLELMFNSRHHNDEKRVSVSFAVRPANQEDIAMSKWILDRAGGCGYAVVDFRDNGKGIPQDQKERIFEPKDSTTGEESLGLGLPLARGFARRLGGDMIECGCQGTEARFLIFLPITH